jgi:preprotein translocase subunit SecD
MSPNTRKTLSKRVIRAAEAALASQQYVRSTILIAMMTAAATGFGSAFANAEDIALSLVHPKGRVDVPVSALGEVKAAATFAFRNTETGQVHEYPDPHVYLCFSEDIQKRICELTRQIVGQPMEIVIDCATISKPIVREPLCTRPCFQVSANDIAEATALAQRIRRGSNRACAPST